MAAAAEPVPVPGVAGMPKVTELGMVSIGLVAGGIIYLAAYLPDHAPLGPAIALLVLAVLVFAANAIWLSKVPDFAWSRFKQVYGWMLLIYAVIAGMIEYAFVYDHTRGAILVVMTCLLATFVVNVPLISGFTVARYERAQP